MKADPAKVEAAQAAADEPSRSIPNYIPRFKKRYNEVIRPAMMKEFGYKNVMQVPRINKIVLNIGAGEGASDGKKVQQAQNDLTAIAGQKAIVTKAKKSIAAFKITVGRADRREGHAAPATGCTNFSTASSRWRCRACATSAD